MQISNIKKLLPLFSFLFVILIFTFLFLNSSLARAGHCPETDYDCQIAEIQRDIDAIAPAHERNKQELANLRSQIQGIQVRINGISVRLNALEKDILSREEDLVFREELFSEKTRQHYMALRQNDPLAPFLFADNATELLRQLSIRQRVINQDQREIEKLAEELVSLKRDKETLERSRAGLQSSQKSLDGQAGFLAGEVAKVEAYIAELSAKQQSLIAKKLASLNLPTSLGAGPLFCVDDRDAKYDPGFRPAFAFFTYGIPHRVGMNQYGAFGRANAGQNHEQILQAYFDNFTFENRDNINITVDGYGSMPLETYLLGIYEMPESWPLEALKAQAIAARSYALSYTDNGAKSICTSQRCQVYKQPPKSGNWKTAVEQTAGKTMVSGGQMVTAWYASTAGGYTFTSADVGWGARSWTKRLRDTYSGVGGFGELQGSAYDKESPCFYSAQGARSGYNKSAWLKAEELADIANVILLARADGGAREHIYQTDKPHPYGGEVWNEERVKQELRNRGITPFNSVSSASISADFGSGQTTNVVVSGDAGSQSFSGTEFKDWFNLRSPANIQIVGPLFNAERK